MDRYQVVTLHAAVYVVDNDEMQASRFAGDWNAHASCELLNSGAMPRTDLDWIDLEPETAEWVTAPDGEEFRVGECQGHKACPVERHEHGCFADEGTNCNHPEEHPESAEQGASDD